MKYSLPWCNVLLCCLIFPRWSHYTTPFCTPFQCRIYLKQQRISTINKCNAASCQIFVCIVSLCLFVPKVMMSNEENHTQHTAGIRKLMLSKYKVSPVTFGFNGIRYIWYLYTRSYKIPSVKPVNDI